MHSSKTASWIFSSILLMTLITSPEKADALGDKSLKYCVPLPVINFDPFREIKDGKETAYLMFLQSYISEEKNEPGILDRFDFSPDGKIFTASVRPGLKWPNGRPVTSKEAALGIAKGLTFRPLGKRLKVKGTEAINKSGWESRSYSGIQILDSSKFSIVFESEIENLTGVLREAISTNARHNRLWPTELGESKQPGQILGKFPISYSEGSYSMSVFRSRVVIVPESKCAHSDFTLYPESLDEPLEFFDMSRSPSAQSIMLTINTNKMPLPKRKALSGWLRKNFENLPEFTGIVPAESIFLRGEAGHSELMKWSTQSDLSELRKSPLAIGYSIPAFKDIIDAAATRDKLKITTVKMGPESDSKMDARVVSSAMHEGRHVILQDFLDTKGTSHYLNHAPKTLESFRAIAKRSAVTIPPDNLMLQTFERSAFQEQAFSPIGRRNLIGFSRKSAVFVLGFTASSELTFLEKNKTQ